MIPLEADAEAVASILFSLGDGFGIQVLADPAGTARPRSSRRADRAPAARRD